MIFLGNIRKVYKIFDISLNRDIIRNFVLYDRIPCQFPFLYSGEKLV